MATLGTGPRSRYAEAVLLTVLAHELVAGAVLWAIGLPGAAGFLWAVGTGLSLGYTLLWLAWQARAPRHRPRLVMAVALLVAVIVAVILGAYVVSDALGTLLVAAVFMTDRLDVHRHHDSSRQDRVRSAFPTLDSRREAYPGRSRQRTGR